MAVKGYETGTPAGSGTFQTGGRADAANNTSTANAASATNTTNATNATNSTNTTSTNTNTNTTNTTNSTNKTNAASATNTMAAGEGQPVLELAGISKTYREGKSRVHVLDQINLTVAEGEFVSIVGPSGSGKSTLFHLIGGLTQPDAGRIALRGRDITGERGHIAYVPQQPALFPWRSTLDNVALGLEVAGIPLREARTQAREWLSKAGLAGYEQALPHRLSGGMQQRAAFLRGLLSPQELMALDEPFSALDALTRSDMQHWLLELWETNRRSVLFITHSIEEALLLSDRIVLLSGRPARVLHEMTVPFPRPRRAEMAEEPEFLRLRREMTELMRTEQRKMQEEGTGR